jgi:hypothetical protein
MSSLRVELHASEWLGKSSSLLKDDWVPACERFAAPPPLRVAHESVSVRHNPGRVTRHFLFALAGRNAIALEARFTLCMDGWADTVDVVFRTLEAHEGHLPRPITETPTELDIGELGFAWGYRDAKTLDALVFARCNEVVFLRRHGDGGLVEYALNLDRELRALATCEAYAVSPTGAFAAVGKARPVKVRQNERLDLGSQPDNEHWFYHSSAGSVNRDPQTPARRYYRAPSEPTRAQLWAYVLRGGLLARRESLEIEVSP